jgi:hypothetical protein
MPGFAGPPPPPPIFGLGGPPPPPLFAPEPAKRLIVHNVKKPKEEMKTLYWNRIQFFNKSNAIWFDVKDVEIEDDFSTLFSKVNTKVAKSKITKEVTTKSSKQEFVKLLDSKRSQAIGILMSSKHLEATSIRKALLDFDITLLNFEILNSIYDIRPQDDELRMINDYLKSENSENRLDKLDKPETFLYELSKIPSFEERLFCLGK